MNPATSRTKPPPTAQRGKAVSAGFFVDMKNIAPFVWLHGCGGVICLLALLTLNQASAADGPMGVERVARLTYAGYVSSSPGTNNDMRWVQGRPEWAGAVPAARINDVTVWVQVDLGRSVRIDKVK